MTFYDWHQDGQKDYADDFIEYQVYKACTGSNHSRSGSSSSDWCIPVVLLAISCVN